MGEFVTAHVHRQLKAVGVQIAEVIHTYQKYRKTPLEVSKNRVRLLARELINTGMAWNGFFFASLHLKNDIKLDVKLGCEKAKGPWD